MIYTKFRIRNFKGIRDTTISLETIAGASVFAFVGLNESGKTTVLEAIHSFSPDTATSQLLGGDETSGIPFRDRVPRHLISTFSGDVSVTATARIEENELGEIENQIKQETGLILRTEQFPLHVEIERLQRFKNGDIEGHYLDIRTSFEVKGVKQRKWRQPTSDERIKIRDILYDRTPDIAYFPTFIFDVPDRFFLSDRGGKVDRFYRRVFQDILDSDSYGHQVERDIVRRVRGESMTLPWVQFLATWMGHDSRQKVDHVMDRASATVSSAIFGKWNKIFGEDTKGKEVVISYETVEGEVTDASGARTKTQKHDVVVKFQIRDGTRRFNVNDRSLGFRWFFAFMLFTQFRVARAVKRRVLFLFDEPASNLHAAAQQKLLESFPKIATNGHALLYSTHSHYMIEPKWLEQTFVVSNRADAPAESLLDEASLEDESLDVKAYTYRSFVTQLSNQVSYFQPILDRLQVVPSRLDLQRQACVVEGKSDYYILRFAIQLLRLEEPSVIPALGAGTMNALAAMNVGWNLKFLFLLDGDAKGKAERDRYSKEFGVHKDSIATISDLLPSAKQIEDLLDVEAKAHISRILQLSADPTKSEIRRFFQERLAADSIVDLGIVFRSRVRELLEAIQGRLITGLH